MPTNALLCLTLTLLENHKLILRSSYEMDGDAVSFKTVFSKSSALKSLIPLISIEKGEDKNWVNYYGYQKIIHYSDLAKIIDFFETSKIRTVNLVVEDAVKNYKEIEEPEYFFYEYIFDPEKNGLIPHSKYTYDREDYFGSAKGYFKVKKSRKKDIKWLKKDIIPCHQLRQFLTEVVPEWQKRGLPYGSNLSFIDKKAFSLQIKDVEEEKVSFQINTPFDLTKAQECKDEDGVKYLLIDNRFLPGFNIYNSILKRKKAFETGSFVLNNQEIPTFIHKHWEKVSPFAEGKILEFQYKHRLFDEKEELKIFYKAIPSYKNGIPTFKAVPVFQFGSYEKSLDDVLDALHDKKLKYFRIDQNGYHGWIPLTLYNKVFKEFKEQSLGFDPIPLSNKQLIGGTIRNDNSIFRFNSFQGSKTYQIQFPFEENILLSLEMCTTEKKHLQTLLRYGIHGGLEGPVEKNARYLVGILEDHIKQFPETKIICLYHPKEINAGGVSLLKKKLPTIELLPYNEIKEKKSLPSDSYDIAIFIDPQDEITGKGKTSYKVLKKTDIRLKLVLFSTMQKCSETSLSTLEEFFDVPSKQLLSWYNFERSDWERVLGDFKWRNFVEREMQSMGISPSSKLDEAYINSTKTFTRSEFTKIMVEITKRVAPLELTIKKPKYTVYKSKQPSIFDMNVDQFVFYIYWRDNFMNGKYINAGSSYVKVFVVEIINQINLKDPAEGYELLLRLWKSYRQGSQKEDTFFINILIDYILLYKIPVHPMDLLWEMSNSGEKLKTPNPLPMPLLNMVADEFPSLVLHYWNRPFSELPIEVLEEILDGWVSKLFTEKNKTTIEQHYVNAFGCINDLFEKQTGVGLFDFYKPLRSSYNYKLSYFMESLWIGNISPVLLKGAVDYNTYLPFEQFTENYTEIILYYFNQLGFLKNNRTFEDFSGLNPLIIKALNTYFHETFKTEIETGKLKLYEPYKDGLLPFKKVEVDMSRIDALVKESQEVREMFITEEEAPKPKKVKSLPNKTKKPLKTDNEWDLLKSQLESYHLTFLEMLMSPKITSQELTALAKEHFTMPDMIVDTINEIALESIGDILINAEMQIEEENKPLVKNMLIL